MIAFLGMGMLGTGFVRAMRRRGEDVQVWNRSPAKAKALETDGAKAFAAAADAVRGASRVHLTLSDDASVDDVLAQIDGVLPEGALVIDHTTCSTEGTLGRIARAHDEGRVFAHAPVFMGPQNALDGTGLMLTSGDRALVEKLRPILEPMTGKVVDLGDRPDAAAAFKLLGNLFLMFINGGCAEMLTLAKAMNVAPTEAAALFQHFNPGATVPARMARMLDTASWDKPSWALSMARKDARLMTEEAARANVPLSFLPAIAARMDALIARGHGEHDWTILAKDALEGG